MADIDLGFAEERDRAWLTNRYFPSKIGGKPAWLDLETLPGKEALKCTKCDNQQAFLCQIYAPCDDDHNFHRSIYVFICRSETCQQLNSASNLTVLRSQLPRKNQFYSEQPPEEDGNPLPEIPAEGKTCFACGCLGPLTCSRCKKANYCSAPHQRAHWPQHKKVCNVESSTSEGAHNIDAPLKEVLFPEWELVIAPNDQESPSSTQDAEDDSEAAEQRRLTEFEKLEAEGKTGAFKDLPETELRKFTETPDEVPDKQFSKFKKEVSKDPEQLLRYNRNGTPLWIADVDKTVKTALQIPNCEHCQGPRQFEFQIMPQMLVLLKDDRLDWGVLAVYTCATSCKPPSGVGYLREYVIKQDILNEQKNN